ncbi:MAG: hypothetical protein ACMUIP_14200 [bacterium]
MVNITETAQERLIELLAKNVPKIPNVFLRIVYSKAKPNTFALVYDRERENDHIAVTDKRGEKVLLIDQVVAEEIDGMVVDYHKTGNDAYFTLNHGT